MKMMIAAGISAAVLALGWAAASSAEAPLDPGAERASEGMAGVEPEAPAAEVVDEARVNWWLIGLGAATAVAVTTLLSEDDAEIPGS